MATRKVSVTSVTPRATVNARTKAQQARTRNLVMGIAAATPAGRVVRGAATVAKAASTARKSGKVVRKLVEPKSNVRVKPARKQVPNSPNESKAGYKFNDSRGRAYNKAAKEYEEGAGKYGNMYEMQDAAREASIAAQTTRKANIASKKLSTIERNKATTPRRSQDTLWSLKTPIKINSQRNLKKTAVKKKSK